MKGYLIMSAKERKRMLVFDRVKEGQLNLIEAAGVVDLSYRQCLTRISHEQKQRDL